MLRIFLFPEPSLKIFCYAELIASQLCWFHITSVFILEPINDIHWELPYDIVKRSTYIPMLIAVFCLKTRILNIPPKIKSLQCVEQSFVYNTRIVCRTNFVRNKWIYLRFCLSITYDFLFFFCLLVSKFSMNLFVFCGFAVKQTSRQCFIKKHIIDAVITLFIHFLSISEEFHLFVYLPTY